MTAEIISWAVCIAATVVLWPVFETKSPRG